MSEATENQVCSKSKAEKHYANSFITIKDCDVNDNKFECSYTCNSDNTEANGLVQCHIGKWNEVYFTEMNHFCIANKKKTPTKLKSSKKKKFH